MAMKSTNLEIGVSPTAAGTFARVDDLNDATMSLGGDNLDVSEFGVAFVERIQGLKDATYSIAGFYNPSDAAGQVAIRNAWLNDTSLFVRFLPDGGTTPGAGFQQEVKVSSFEVSASADGVVEVSIELEGTGAVTAA